ncbi:MAG TPA: YqiA/YcfP family alpha/beta fold hydrolase [Candidatus Acidoferrales bacterium]|nr:YqiA/YcfP family alpha/beta fold hydrolase [Candidatus Acidoferrales bacterium]
MTSEMIGEMTRIVYLHGFASGPSSSKARYFRQRLQAAGARVEIPDLAAGDFEHLTITGQLAVVERAVQQAAHWAADWATGPSGHPEPVALMGSSLGGYLAALYAARHPEVVRLVLLAPAFGFARRWPERLGAEQVAQWQSAGAMEVFHYGENRTRSLSYALLEDAARYEDYPDFHQPALLFHGAGDDVVPVRYSREFSATHPNATLEVLDSGHDLLNVLEYMAPKVERFLLRTT